MIKAEDFIDSHFDEYIKLICDLTSIPAPSGKEEKRAAFILKLLKDWGYTDAHTDEAGNVVCEIAGKDTRAKKHFFMAHLDTVFPDESSIEVTVSDDRISAPGVGDDTANACALLMCLRFLSENPVMPEVSTVFAFDTCEEGLGNLKGSRQIMKDYGEVMGQLVSFDLGYDKIYNTAVGSRRFEIGIETKGGHSFNDFGNPNAIAAASELICALYDIDAASMPGKTTCNVGLISGGTSVNTIAQNAEFLYEYRSDTMKGLTMMAQAFENVISEFEADKDLKLTVRMIGDRPSMGDVDPKAMKALTDHVRQIILDETGLAAPEVSGSTDCNMPLSVGIPAICFGTCLDIGPHTRQEYVPVSSLRPGFLVAVGFLLGDMTGWNGQ